MKFGQVFGSEVVFSERQICQLLLGVWKCSCGFFASHLRWSWSCNIENVLDSVADDVPGRAEPPPRAFP